MRAVAAAALVLVLAGGARAEDAPAGAIDAAPARAIEAVEAVAGAPWFLGASVGHGRISFENARTAEGTTFAAEGGRFLAPWFAVSLSLGLGRRHGSSDLLGPITPAELLDLTLGPRLALAPLRGRIRLGVGFGVLRHRITRIGVRGDATMVTREVDSYTELHASVVPLRRGTFEVELGAARGAAGSPSEGGFDEKIWYTVGVGLRWYAEAVRPPPRAAAEVAPVPAIAAGAAAWPASRWSLAPSLAVFAMRGLDGPMALVPLVELALRYRARPALELELAVRHGRPRLEGQFSVDDTDAAFAAEHATLAVRRRIRTGGQASWFAGAGAGVARAAHTIGGSFDSTDEELRPLVLAGAGTERRYRRALSLRAELGLMVLLPSSYSGNYGGGSLTVEHFRQADVLLLVGATAGASYHF